MDRDKIINVLEKEESNKLEFKERFSNSVLKTISAFANTYGGLIIVGVNNRREVAGIDADDKNTEKLLSCDASMPRNPTIFNIFYLAGIVESVGSGIERMTNALKDAGLPELKIEANHVDFTLVFFKDVYTEEYLQRLGLNERQIKAVMYVKEKGRITNREYRELNKVSNKTAYLELEDLVKRKIFSTEGIGKALTYVPRVMKK